MTFAEQCTEMHALEREALERGISGSEYEDILRDVTADIWATASGGPVEILAEVRKRVYAARSNRAINQI